MKETDGRNPSIEEVRDKDGKQENKERSRGKRRTAREIAQMFEQLKQRHLTRKQEWHNEKQELLKQASLADESKRLLVELKVILEELKGQIIDEEKKRESVEGEYETAKIEWKMEKERLLKIIADLESKRFCGSDERRAIDELNVVKSRLQVSEKEVLAVRKENLELNRSMKEMKRLQESEKQKLIKEHDGEKKNWEKSHQVMLDKIETLQEELRSLRAETYPLHGSHIATPLDDVIVGLTSPDTDELYSEIDRNHNLMDVECQQSPVTSVDQTTVEEPSNTYAYFQRTVDEALTQIEKITHDLEQVSTSGCNKDEEITSPVLQRTSLVTSSDKTDATQGLSKRMQPHQRNQVSKTKSFKLSPAQPSELSCSNYSCVEQKEVNEERLRNEIEDSSCASSIGTRYNRRLADEPQRYRNISSETSLSPSSCSLPTFTESSAESPHRPPSNQTNLTTHVYAPRVTITNLSDEENLSDVGKNTTIQNSKRKDSNGSITSKKLPNLHQQLLFGNASKTLKTQKSLQDSDMSNTPASGDMVHFRSKTNLKSTAIAKPTPQIKLRSKGATDDVDGKLSGNNRKVTMKKQSTFDFVENISPKSNSGSFTDGSLSKTTTSLSDKVNVPPLRPKPSVTIEKDVEGNVLRVISDPQFQRQELPRNPQKFQEHQQNKSRRRRSEDLIHPLEPLVRDQKFPISEEFIDIKSNKPYEVYTEQKENSPASTQEKVSFGSKGKSWIKKRLSFLDNSQKTDPVISPKTLHSPKKRNRRNIARMTALQKEKNIGDEFHPSTSEESDDNREKPGLKQSYKEAKDKKGKLKRYSRSKTDSSVDVKNLLSKFKATQFRSKKPSIVKEFEKKLLENEVKVLEEESIGRRNMKQKDESSERIKSVQSKISKDDDNGYNGEDELDYISRRRRRLENTGAKMTRTASLKSLPEESLVGSYYHPSSHTSLLNLTICDYFETERDESLNIDNLQSDVRTRSSSVTHEAKKSHGNIQFVRTTFADNVGSTVEDPYKPHAESAKQFDRASPGRLSLPDRHRFSGEGKKRLSWAANLKRSIEEEVDDHDDQYLSNNSSTNRDLGDKSNDVSTSRSTGSIVLKPKSETNIKPTSEPGSKHITLEASKNQPKGRMSEEMKEKAANIERALKNGSKTMKMRRYKRSETQPLHRPSSTDDSDSSSKSTKLGRTQSFSADNFSENLVHDIAPGLNLLFKKPLPAHRRLPSRWKKKDHDEAR